MTCIAQPSYRIYKLNTDSMPVLATLQAFGSLFNSPVKADVYFINTRDFIDQNWGTKNPIMMRDPDLSLVRVRGFGKFSFKVTDVRTFFSRVCAAQHLYMSFPVVQYLGSIVAETIAMELSKNQVSVFDLASNYRAMSTSMLESVNQRSNEFGVTFTSLLIENISLPDEVEKLIDEQSGIGLAKRDMDTFVKYQTVRAMRDAAQQDGGLAGLGAGAVIGAEMADSLSATRSNAATKEVDVYSELKKLKELMDCEIITPEEFAMKKKTLLDL